jgi:glycosyltransferase involved in cell wall biosynthesis
MSTKKILVIGQTPPPYGGQSINIGRMISALDQKKIDYRFLRMNFSEEMNETGKFNLMKVWKLFKLVMQIISSLITYRPNYVYYPPSGPEIIPVYRDILVLFFVRMFGFKTIFHFHAGGLSDIYPTLSPILKSLFRFTFFNPTYSICLSKLGTKDPLFLNCKDIKIIPSGVDNIICKSKTNLTDNNKFVVLFVGVCRETKGILDFIKIIEVCNKNNDRIVGRVIGKAFSEKEELAINNAVNSGILIYEGVKTGSIKNQIFCDSNLFLFPTFFEHENFPTVILEAFSCGLPVIATQWRGVSDQIIDGKNGYIHPIHDILGMSNSILTISHDDLLHQTLSRNARLDYLQNYSISKFEENIINFFTTLK